MAKRKGRWKDRLKFVLPILILLVGVAFVVTFEFYIKDKVNTVEVVVAKNDIDFKKRISEDDLTVMDIKKGSEVEESYRPDELERVVGELASIEIKKGTQLYPDLIDNYDLLPDESEGEFIAPLPDDWIFAVAGSLRRSYIADIYIVGGEEQEMLESLIEDSKEYEDGNKQSSDKENEEDSSSDEPLNTDEQTDEVIKDMYKPILKNVKISSVKDSGNSEVTQSKESPNSATGSISNLEIVATNKMLQTIQEKTSKGYKLYIVHKFDRSEDIESDEESEGEE